MRDWYESGRFIDNFLDILGADFLLFAFGQVRADKIRLLLFRWEIFRRDGEIWRLIEGIIDRPFTEMIGKIEGSKKTGPHMTQVS